jgi:hypothetical protein
MRFLGVLRVSEKEQEEGGDLAVMGAPCYSPKYVDAPKTFSS